MVDANVRETGILEQPRDPPGASRLAERRRGNLAEHHLRINGLRLDIANRLSSRLNRLSAEESSTGASAFVLIARDRSIREDDRGHPKPWRQKSNIGREDTRVTHCRAQCVCVANARTDPRRASARICPGKRLAVVEARWRAPVAVVAVQELLPGHASGRWEGTHEPGPVARLHHARHAGVWSGAIREVATSREVTYVEEKGTACSAHSHRRNHTLATERASHDDSAADG